MRRRWIALSANQNGLAAVEFALLVPALITLICASIEVGYLYTAQTSLTGAVAAAARNSATTQEKTANARRKAVKTLVTKSMNQFPLADDQSAVIEVAAFHSFGDTHPEDYTDVNSNGKYDPPAPNYVGEPFVDQNGNGVWDAELPYKTNSVGEPGDVVRYTATYPVQGLFAFLTSAAGWKKGISLSSTAIVRNEPVKTE